MLKTLKKIFNKEDEYIIKQLRKIALGNILKEQEIKINELKKLDIEINFNRIIIEDDFYNPKELNKFINTILIQINTINTNNSIYVFIIKNSIKSTNEESNIFLLKEKNKNKKYNLHDNIKLFNYKEDFLKAIKNKFDETLSTHKQKKFPFLCILAKTKNIKKPTPANNIDYISNQLKKIA